MHLYDRNNFEYDAKTLYKFVLRDAEFIRFLKERGLCQWFFKLIRYNDSVFVSFRQNTVDKSRYLFEFVNQRRYIYHGFPVASGRDVSGINWALFDREWAEILKAKNVQKV